MAVTLIVLGNYLSVENADNCCPGYVSLCLFAHILWVSGQYLRYMLASRFAYLR